MSQVLSAMKRRLSNLGTNNKSLLLPRLSAEQYLDLQSLDFLNGKPAIDILMQVVKGQKQITLLPLTDPRNTSVNRVSVNIAKIVRKAASIFEETGSQDLLLGWPFVNGKFSDGTPVHAPLLFFPIQIEKEAGYWKLNIPRDSAPVFNKTFLLAYAHYSGHKPDDELLEYSFENPQPDWTSFITQLYQLLQHSQINLNFNRELFEGNLKPFKEHSRADLEKLHEAGILKLEPEAVVGIFPQTDTFMVPDFDFLIDNYNEPDIEGLFASHSPEILKTIHEADDYSPFPMDGSQETAFRRIKSGESLVVQGPPGSGKSQLIANLVADFASSGKKILVVCQKKVALDVVFARLDKLGMANFMALIHDFRADRSHVYAQISKQIAAIDDNRSKNNSFQSVQLAQNFSKVSHRIQELSNQLHEFAKALFQKETLGISAKTLYLDSDPTASHLLKNLPFQYFKPENLDQTVQKLSFFYSYQESLPFPSPFWEHRKPFTHFQFQDLEQIKAGHEVKIPLLKNALKGFGTLSAAQYFAEGTETLESLNSLIKSDQVFQLLNLHLSNRTGSKKGQALLARCKLELDYIFSGSGPYLELEKSELPELIRFAKSALPYHDSAAGWLYFKFTNKGSKGLVRHLEKLKLKPANLPDFIVRLEKREKIEILSDTFSQYLLPSISSKENWFIWLNELQQSFQALQFYKNIPFPNGFSLSKLKTANQFISKSRELKQQSLSVKTLSQELSHYFSVRQLELMLEGKVSNADFRFLEEHFDKIVALDSLIASLSEPEKEVLEQLAPLAKTLSRPEFTYIFTNSLKLAWLQQIETEFPVLKSVSNLQMDHWEEEIRARILEKRKLVTELVKVRLEENTYNGLQYNRLQNLVSYRNLNHQVSKKKKIWPVRKLVAQFADEIFNLVPCWLASPETVSAIFPMEQFFDLVIFDEASQCFSERGLPAMFRGKQVVIVGDDKQLSPFNLYQTRMETTDEDAPAEMEAESLLKLAEQYYPQVMLRGHYRSRAQELIAFSNRHFYDGKLMLVPNRSDLNNNEPVITFTKVDGIWANNQNLAEAEAVLREIENLIKATSPENLSLGIVTFNAQQQTLIASLLEEFLQENRLPQSGFKEPILVKNIENIQGDERDIIIFSPAYAPNASGKMNLSFGSLNAIGGENRLNVAITRARIKIMVFCSFWPEQLNTEQSVNRGPKMLKSYLEYCRQVSDGFKEKLVPGQTLASFGYGLKDKLAAENPNLLPEQPFADLILKQNGQSRALILTDDELFQQTSLAKENHAYRYFRLSEKNWPFVQLFSRQYWLNKQQVKDKIEKLEREAEINQ